MGKSGVCIELVDRGKKPIKEEIYGSWKQRYEAYANSNSNGPSTDQMTYTSQLTIKGKRDEICARLSKGIADPGYFPNQYTSEAKEGSDIQTVEEGCNPKIKGKTGVN